MAERTTHPVLRFGFAIATILLSLAALEMAMRYLDRPHAVVSGWRATDPLGPVNALGYRGQPSRSLRLNDFVIILTGAAAVECLACPREETLDVMLERAVRQFNPNARVVTLGSGGYSQDQEYLALHQFLALRHADLVIDWASFADDVPGNTFRTGRTGAGQIRAKPTFVLRGEDSVGPTEGLGAQVYKTKITTLLRPLFIDLDRNWTTLLPRADPGASSPPSGAETQSHVTDLLEQQRTAWSIWMTPRPARVAYGIALTRALLRHMRDLSMLRGARFAILVAPDPTLPTEAAPTRRTDAPIALEHDGHWFLADPATRDAAIAAITAGFDTITLPAGARPLDSQAADPSTTGDAAASPFPAGGGAAGVDRLLEGTPATGTRSPIVPAAVVNGGTAAAPPADAQRQLMARLAEVLNEQRLLTPIAADRPRH